MIKEIVMVCYNEKNDPEFVKRIPILDQEEVEEITNDLENDPNVLCWWEVEGETIGHMNIFTGEIASWK